MTRFFCKSTYWRIWGTEVTLPFFCPSLCPSLFLLLSSLPVIFICQPPHEGQTLWADSLAACHSLLCQSIFLPPHPPTPHWYPSCICQALSGCCCCCCSCEMNIREKINAFVQSYVFRWDLFIAFETKWVQHVSLIFYWTPDYKSSSKCISQ